MNWIFWGYVAKNHKEFASASDPRLLAISARVWLIISIGWLISVPLGFVNVYVAYALWILLPNIVAIWGNYQRKYLQTAGTQHVKTKDKKQKVAA
jgi:hypothetical protein